MLNIYFYDLDRVLYRTQKLDIFSANSIVDQLLTTMRNLLNARPLGRIDKWVEQLNSTDFVLFTNYDLRQLFSIQYDATNHDFLVYQTIQFKKWIVFYHSKILSIFTIVNYNSLVQ